MSTGKMKYANLDLGTIEATFNILGGIEGAARLRRGELVLIEATKPEPVSKFALLVDLGIITVPADYIPTNEFAGGNFPNPSWVLKPGQRLWVRAHKQVLSGTTTSEERMQFLASLGSHYTGAQGVKLVHDHKRNQLPKGYWYCSFDEKNRLWLDSERFHRVPGVSARSHGDFLFFRLGFFRKPWGDGDAILSFCDEPSGA